MLSTSVVIPNHLLTLNLLKCGNSKYSEDLTSDFLDVQLPPNQIHWSSVLHGDAFPDQNGGSAMRSHLPNVVLVETLFVAHPDTDVAVFVLQLKHGLISEHESGHLFACQCNVTPAPAMENCFEAGQHLDMLDFMTFMDLGSLLLVQGGLQADVCVHDSPLKTADAICNAKSMLPQTAM